MRCGSVPEHLHRVLARLLDEAAVLEAVEQSAHVVAMGAHAVVLGLPLAEHLLEHRAATATLEVRGDSQLVIQQVLGQWKAKDERMRTLRDEVRRLLNNVAKWRLVQQPREDSVRVLGH